LPMAKGNPSPSFITLPEQLLTINNAATAHTYMAKKREPNR